MDDNDQSGSSFMWSSGVSRSIGSFLSAKELCDIAKYARWEEPHPASEMMGSLVTQAESICLARLAATMGQDFVRNSLNPIFDLQYVEAIDCLFSKETTPARFFACRDQLALAFQSALEWKDRLLVLSLNPLKRVRNVLVQRLFMQVQLGNGINLVEDKDHLIPLVQSVELFDYMLVMHGDLVRDLEDLLIRCTNFVHRSEEQDTDDELHRQLLEVFYSEQYVSYARSRPSSILMLMDELLVSGDSQLDLYNLYNWSTKAGHYALCPLQVMLHMIHDWQNDHETLFTWVLELAQAKCTAINPDFDEIMEEAWDNYEYFSSMDDE